MALSKLYGALKIPVVLGARNLITYAKGGGNPAGNGNIVSYMGTTNKHLEHLNKSSADVSTRPPLEMKSFDGPNLVGASKQDPDDPSLHALFSTGFHGYARVFAEYASGLFNAPATIVKVQIPKDAKIRYIDTHEMGKKRSENARLYREAVEHGFEVVAYPKTRGLTVGQGVPGISVDEHTYVMTKNAETSHRKFCLSDAEIGPDTHEAVISPLFANIMRENAQRAEQRAQALRSINPKSDPSLG